MNDTDPVESSAPAESDLYDVATWEPRTVLDRIAVRLHGALAGGARLGVVLLALLVFVAQIGGVVWLASRNPTLGVVALLSALPALALVAFVWRQDVVEKEPLDTIAITFVLAVLFASFAAVVNGAFSELFRSIPLIGMGLFFFLVVGPVEETVKWLAVRLHAYRRTEFDAVIDGAVYGAVAGLGFATIENMLYVVQGFLRAQDAGSTQAIGAALGTATSRALAGPGHVIYSAWAGYYLGLAKFNREHRGPLVVKGLLIAALIHGTYNSFVTSAPMASLPAWSYLLFVVGFDGLFFYLLYRKLARYRDSYQGLVDGEEADEDEADAEAVTDEPETDRSGAVWDDPVDGSADDGSDADGSTTDDPDDGDPTVDDSADNGNESGDDQSIDDWWDESERERE